MKQHALRVLIIDHYDSYTNNILQLLTSPSDGDEASVPTWSPVIVKYDRYTWLDFQNQILPEFDAIILSPGPGRPDNAGDFGFNSQLIREADIPILGICLGHQGIGTSFGASVVHAQNIKHGQVSQIQHNGTGLFEGLPQNFGGVQYNSLVIDANTLPNELVPTAWTRRDSEPATRTLMGLRHATRPIHGVQWHPESICSSYGRRILDNFHCIVQDFWLSSPQRRERYRMRPRTQDFPPSLPCTKGQHHDSDARIATLTAKPLAYVVKSIELSSTLTPDVVFEHWVHKTSNIAEAWLDSAKSRDEHSKFSYLAAGSFTIDYSTHTKLVTIRQPEEDDRTLPLAESFWSWLDCLQRDIQADTQPLPTDHDVATLQVGFIGHFGYEMKRESLPGYHWVRRANDAKCDVRDADAQFMFANEVLRYDHTKRSWKLFALVRASRSDPVSSMLGLGNLGLTQHEFDIRCKDLQRLMSCNIQGKVAPQKIPKFSSNHDEDSYGDLIAKTKHAIQEGDSYEMTLTTKFHARAASQDHLGLYLFLRAKNPAPYSAYMNFSATKTTILSSSPERFVSVDARGHAEMKPIKGTVAVSKDPIIDAGIKERLQRDVKELAENLMIVDLIRNDLHRISSPESIVVPKLMQVETYETVHQLVTTIRSQVHPTIGSVEAIKRIFPPGSMTGAPKLRSVQILDQLEGGRDRGVYSGCLGYICVSGAVDQSVVIRTIVCQDNHLELGAGGAITWLSDASKEWEEVLIKANAVAPINLAKADEGVQKTQCLGCHGVSESL